MSPLVGIFGGTFSPPHRGHLALAAAARRQLGLERLLWVLTPDPPHKQGQSILPAEHRLAMVRLVLARYPEYELSTIEFDRPGPHYALDTVRILGEQNPQAGLVYLMGGDSLRDLPTWHHPADLVAASWMRRRWIFLPRRSAAGLPRGVPSAGCSPLKFTRTS